MFHPGQRRASGSDESRNVTALRAHEGRFVYSAADAIFKGMFESEREVSTIIVPDCDAFAQVLQRSATSDLAAMLRQYGTTVRTSPNSQRGMALAMQAARSGRNTVAMIASCDLPFVTNDLAAAARGSLQKGTSVCVMVEDNPHREAACSELCPRSLMCRLRVPTMEPVDLATLRDAIEQALRLSRSSGRIVGIIVHTSVLQSWQTLEARPNRATAGGFEAVDVLIARRRRARPRWSETRDPLRLARRLEINRVRALPSPGEIVPVGFVTVGPADPALRHVVSVLHLAGRVPIFSLGLLWPLDEAALVRFLERCNQVVVLEPRPGSMERVLISAAEEMRRNGHRLATIWGEEFPGSSTGAGSQKVEVEGKGLASSSQRTEPHQTEPGEALHPSRLVRRIIHLLHGLRPSRRVASHLIPAPSQINVSVPPRGRTIGIAAARELLKRSLADVDQWLRNQTQGDDQPLLPSALAIDGVEPGASSGKGAERIVPVEIFEAETFAHTGIAAIRQAARDARPWILIVLNFETPDRMDIERLARGVVPGDRTERLQILWADLNDRFSLRARLQEAAVADRVTVLLVRDAPLPQHDLRAIERKLTEIDARGFEHSQRVIRSVDHACLFPQQQEEDGVPGANQSGRDPQGRLAMRTEVSVDRFAPATRVRLRLKVQPLLEQIEVVRSRAPAWIWRSQVGGRLELPSPLHRKQAQWRAHIAGCRGRAPGVVAEVLLHAGRNMGYDVSAAHSTTPIGPGVRAWSQVLYTRPRAAGSAPELTAIIPYGEADLLIGIDPAETIRAVNPNSPGSSPDQSQNHSPEQSLRVAHTSGTCAVVNIGRFSGESERSDDVQDTAAVHAAIGHTTREQERTIEDYAAACRSWFQTDRLADLAMLGVAFQRGFVPVSLEAIERAVHRIEQQGFGRSREAFEFGRSMAVERRLLSRPRSDAEEAIELQMRRMVRMLRKRRLTGPALSGRFERLLQQAITSMPGLSETAAGRKALRTFVTAVYRCLEWGGFDYASRYAELIMALYRADRGEQARAVTRDAILPLAEAMLIHDPIYTASMATSLEQRYRLRHAMNVKNARGDSIERRYLTRIELIAMDRRFRADVRTSDWPARLARMSRHLLPSNWRGTRRERELRTFIIELVQQAVYGCANEYDRWRDVMWRLHLQAVDNRLRDMTLAELKLLTEMDDLLTSPAATPPAKHDASPHQPTEPAPDPTLSRTG